MKWQFEIKDVPLDAEYPVEAFQVNDSGVRRGPFYFKVEDLIDALSQEPENTYAAEDERFNEISTPSLPYGTIRYSTNECNSKHRVTMVLPKKNWDIRYGVEDEFFNIGFPRMVLQYLVVPSNKKHLKISEMRIYAVKDDRKPITDETPLFTFPYPNVGKTNAIVCWGQNARMEIESLNELERAFLWFVSAPFNEDHGVRTTHGYSNFRRLIETIKDTPFNDEWLMPSQNSFGDLFKK